MGSNTSLFEANSRDIYLDWVDSAKPVELAAFMARDSTDTAKSPEIFTQYFLHRT